MGPPVGCRVNHPGPVAVAERCLGQQRHPVTEVSESLDVVSPFHPVDNLGGHRHGPLGLLVPRVADVDDLVALLGASPHFVVDLGDQRAHRVDLVAGQFAGPSNHLGR